MSNLAQMKANVNLQIMANLLGTDIVAILNQAHKELVDLLDWTALLTTVQVNIIIPISVGTVTATNGSAVVIGVGTSFANNDIGKAIKIGGTDMPILVASVQSATQLTLEGAFPGPTGTTLSYSLFPYRYVVPDAQEVFGVRVGNLTLTEKTIGFINSLDPDRSATADKPRFWLQDGFTDGGDARIQVWPVGSQARSMRLEIKQRARDLSADSDISQVPSPAVEAKALVNGCLALFASQGSATWLQLADRYQAQFEQALERARAADIRRRVAHSVGDPSFDRRLFDADFFPSHAVDPFFHDF